MECADYQRWVVFDTSSALAAGLNTTTCRSCGSTWKPTFGLWGANCDGWHMRPHRQRPPAWTWASYDRRRIRRYAGFRSNRRV